MVKGRIYFRIRIMPVFKKGSEICFLIWVFTLKEIVNSRLLLEDNIMHFKSWGNFMPSCDCGAKSTAQNKNNDNPQKDRFNFKIVTLIMIKISEKIDKKRQKNKSKQPIRSTFNA